MSSNIGTQQVNWERIHVAYMGAQKNLGPAGCCVVIVKKSLLGFADKDVPLMNDWRRHIESPNGYYNTPPTFSIYVMGMNVALMNQQGGVPHFEEMAQKKSEVIYNTIDTSNGFYSCNTQVEYRSKINIIFRLPTPELEREFIERAKEVRILNIKGHSSNPGIRISIYNAMPFEGVKFLSEFMYDFMEEHNSQPHHDCDITVSTNSGEAVSSGHMSPSSVKFMKSNPFSSQTSRAQDSKF
mmetsp:Transcript_1997/g.3534  ORF Transcript_1997/g.3534 Transcript_1997/m.3534 type:complete len:240 (-) Transcript_1997:201-920(-)